MMTCKTIAGFNCSYIRLPTHGVLLEIFERRSCLSGSLKRCDASRREIASMDLNSIYSVLDRIGVARTKVFVSISSKDKEKALRLVSMLEDSRIRQWCMYYEKGRERNMSGDNYKDVIASELRECCTFVWMVSKHSLRSDEVADEIMQIVDARKKEPYARIQIIPIIIDDINIADIPQRVADWDIITPQVISRRYTDNSTDADIHRIFDEICSQYINVLLENIGLCFQKNKDALKFEFLMCKCIEGKCSASTVSEDIKGSSEMAVEQLKELHVVSNELHEYDCNTYSCMIIAGNILGAEKIEDGIKRYAPEKRGIKYFYYVPVSYIDDCKVAFAKIRSFVSKNEASRKEVVNMIKREYCFKKKIFSFLSELAEMREDDFIEQYGITRRSDKEKIYSLFAEDDVQVYFDYSEDHDNYIFRVPDEVKAWLIGDCKVTYNNLQESAFSFIDFIGKFLGVLKEAEDKNNIAFERLSKRYSHLNNLKLLEEWQICKRSMSKLNARRLVNRLLSADSDMGGPTLKTRFPRLSSWMEFDTDSEGNEISMDYETVEAACRNLVIVPVTAESNIKLCYSFALFYSSDGLSGAWYSTGQKEVNGFIENTVMTCNIERRSDLLPELCEAFEYLILSNQSIGYILEKNKSKYYTKILNMGRSDTSL